MNKVAEFVPRKEFNYAKRLSWKPGHQIKAKNLLQTKFAHKIDLIIQMRDARIPFSSAPSHHTSSQPNLSSTSTQRITPLEERRQVLTVFNKSDLANSNMITPILNAYKKYTGTCDNVLFTSVLSDKSVKKILKFAIDKANADPQLYPYISMVIVGLPNIGKSSMVNALRRIGVQKKKVTHVAPYAGVTTAIQTRVKIWNDPPVYLVDTPGILDVEIKNAISGLKIALVGGTKDSLVEMTHLADYLLFKGNHWGSFRKKYITLFQLSKPTNDITSLLYHIAKTRNFLFDKNKPPPEQEQQSCGEITTKLHYNPFEYYDLERAALVFVNAFRKGELGALTLDECTDETLEEYFLK